MGAKLILVVDDEEAIRRMLITILEENGYLAAAAENGEEALRIAAAVTPDMILLDLRMPAFDGNAFLEAVRHMDIKAPIIVMTGYLGDLKEELKSQVRSVVAKPFAPAEILAVIASAFEGQQG